MEKCRKLMNFICEVKKKNGPNVSLCFLSKALHQMFQNDAEEFV